MAPRGTGRREGELSAVEAAAVLRITPQSLSAWTNRPDAPCRKVGTRVWVQDPQFFRWREAELVRQAKSEVTGPLSFEEGRARKVAAEAELAEIELAIQRRQLLTVADWESALTTLLDGVRARLLALPGRLAPLVAGVDSVPAAVAVIEPVVAEVLSDLAGDDSLVLPEIAA